MGKKWRRHNDGRRPMHIWPDSDLIDHDTDDGDGGCACGPTTEPVKRDDGSVSWIIIHHSLDGREQHERTTP